MVRFWWPCPCFQDHYSINTQKASLGNAIKGFCANYLINQWMEFDQTSIDTLSGWGKEVIRFW